MTYFVDPYKKYYDSLSGASSMTADAEAVSAKVSEVGTTVSSLNSSISTSGWQEMGITELSSNVLPSLDANHKTVSSNISNSLQKIVAKALGELLPETQKLKEEDEKYDKLNEELKALTPVDQYDSNGKENPGYSAYISKKNELETNIAESKKKCEEYVKKCDSLAGEIKGMDGSVEDFKKVEAAPAATDSTQDGTGTAQINGVVPGTDGKMIQVTVNGKTYMVCNTKINCLDYEKYVQKNGLHQNAGLLGGECMLLSQYYCVDMLRGTYTTKNTMANTGGGPALRINDYVKSPNREPILQYIYNEAVAGRPTVLQATQVRSNEGLRHLVTVVGFDSSIKSYKDLTPDKILVLDCVDGKIQTLGQSRESGGHARDLFAQGGNYFARGATKEFLAKEVYKTGDSVRA